MTALLLTALLAGQPSDAEVATSLTRPWLSAAQVFRALRVGEGRALPEALRVRVAREAVRKLAAAADQFAAIRAARDEAAGLPAAVRAPLERFHEATRRRLLARALEGVREPAEAGRWADAAKAGSSWLTQLSAVRPDGEGKEVVADHAAAEAACRAAAAVGEKLAALDAYRAALDAAATARDLAAIDAARLPEPLRRGHRTLLGLAELREAVAAKGFLPDVKALKHSLARLEGAVDVEPGLMSRAALDLAVKAFVEGHPVEALKLMPADAPPGHAAALLRDLKALTLGSGTPETWPGAAAPDAPRPPPAVEPLVPKANRGAWRPPTRAKAAALPLAEAAAKVRGAAAAALKAERGKLDADAAAARKALADALARVIAPDLAERRRYASVEYRLGRRLTPAERTAVREWVEDGKPVEAVVAHLGAADDEGRYLDEVARLVGRGLTAEDHRRARALRADGRRAVEAAELLRP